MRDVLGQRTSLRQAVEDLVRSALAAGTMVPGEVYSVPLLAAQYGVSGTPVREALLDLAKEGLLEPMRNKGFRVVRLSDRDLDDIHRLRELLEVPTLADVADTATPAELARLREVCRRTEQAAAETDLAGYAAADREFHLGLLALAGNSRLVELVTSLRSQSGLSGRPPRALAVSAREHRALLGLVAKGDVPGAQDLLRRHLRRGRPDAS